MIARSISELPILSAREAMIDPLMIAATFVVPPPMSTTAAACSSPIGTPACFFSSREQRALFDLRHFGKHAHDRATAEMRHTASCFPDEVVQHCPGSFEISYHAVNERSDHRDIACLASLHLVRFVADCDNLAGGLVNCDDGRLINDDTSTSHGNDRARRTHVDGH
jgi:hypothetical protein